MKKTIGLLLVVGLLIAVMATAAFAAAPGDEDAAAVSMWHTLGHATKLHRLPR